jgi:hypothetical protein
MIGAAGCSDTGQPDTAPGIGRIEFSSSFAALDTGFAWAKAQALAYAFEGDPVGAWYEAALPGREAFCMRDVSHQAIGALALGLAPHTKNMMRKFAENIAESRDWASYWEIDRYDRPAPVDYRSDDDFWYNLPANFDVIHSIARIFEWTGDRDYVTGSVFLRFYHHSLTDYVAAWDLDGDGMMESAESNGYRGIPTYWEGGGPRALTGGDLVAAQYAANVAFAETLALRGEEAAARPFRDAAERLRRTYNDEWWNDATGRFHTAIVQDGSFDPSPLPLGQVFPLYFGIIEPGERRDRVIDSLPDGEIIEINSYLPEVYYRSGRTEKAFSYLMWQLDPERPRREYPENSFTAIGTVVRYLMGIHPIASDGVIETKSRLPPEVEWAEVTHVPVLANEVGVRHVGLTETRFRNESGKTIRWRAVLPGTHETIDVDGQRTSPVVRTSDGEGVESAIEVDVPPGFERAVRAIGGV